MPAAAPAAAAPPKAAPKKNLGIHLFAGGVAGCCEALSCHPLDTIKVRLQLRGERAAKRPITTVAGGAMNAAAANAVKPPSTNFISVGINIAQKEGVLSLYKGLGAVVTGIVPKMAIRFSSFEYFKAKLANKETGVVSAAGNFVAGLAAGTTEAVLVVTPMDVIKIRLQAQRHSMTDPLDVPKYRNAAHCVYVMVKEEGVASLYKGVGLTALRQATNQAANFTVYQYLRKALHDAQPQHETLPAYQHLVMGFVSGACGPLFNAPIDCIKTRIQKNRSEEKGWSRFVKVTKGIIQNEGYGAFYRGLTPRVLRVAPGQAITFMVYERVYKWLVAASESMKGGDLAETGASSEN
ncbi:hypothetical protein HDU87_001466 [Geranomyces variabilis]|uniref:Uncharacterized protein n=1 Tax=Geranomyces variabilis TaxID=109894 RepID=A0AAD5TB32_9FUNG|nr:hypothetical protein HDU87_001466 [Geranomyces variabilis]